MLTKRLRGRNLHLLSWDRKKMSLTTRWLLRDMRGKLSRMQRRQSSMQLKMRFLLILTRWTKLIQSLQAKVHLPQMILRKRGNKQWEKSKSLSKRKIKWTTIKWDREKIFSMTPTLMIIPSHIKTMSRLVNALLKKSSMRSQQSKRKHTKTLLLRQQLKFQTSGKSKTSKCHSLRRNSPTFQQENPNTRKLLTQNQRKLRKIQTINSSTSKTKILCGLKTKVTISLGATTTNLP